MLVPSRLQVQTALQAAGHRTAATVLGWVEAGSQLAMHSIADC